jgi:hypothetical protein
MPAKSPVRRRMVAAIAAIERHNGPSDPRVAPLRAQLAAADLEERIRQAPPLTASQREHLAGLLRTVGASDGS